jgi:hypothetical protein
VFDVVWPFIDNVWVERNKRSPSRKTYNCRLWQKSEKSKGQGIRENKVIRDHPLCKAKIVVEVGDEEVKVYGQISKEGEFAARHNHDLEYSDLIKINSAIRAIAKVIQNHLCAAVAGGRASPEAKPRLHDLTNLSLVSILRTISLMHFDSNTRHQRC